MPILLLAAASLLAAQAPAGATAAPDRQARAAEIALKSFSAGCLGLLRAAHTPAEYADGAAQLGAKLAATPEIADLPVRLEGVEGRACRVTLTAAPRDVDAQWSAITGAVRTCTASSSGPDAIRYACPAGAGLPPFGVEFRRSRLGADARLVSTVTYGAR